MALQVGVPRSPPCSGASSRSCRFAIAYYYVTVTASIAMGLYDRVRAGAVPIGWEKVEGTR